MQKHPFIEFIPYRIVEIMLIPILGWLYAWLLRIHRSCIVSAEQIARVELFGKETYQVRLKNGACLRASNTGYRLLKERLSL